MLGAYDFLFGTIFSLIIALLAFKGDALSISGTIAAMLLGAVVYWFGGWVWFLLLSAFFLSSSWFTHYKEKEKETVCKEFAKPGPRDLLQVLANGALPSLIAVGHYFYPLGDLFVLFAGIIAAVNADTWATEVGILSKSRPRLFIGWKKVAVGTSGAVSAMGTAYAFLGSLFIAVAAIALKVMDKGFAAVGLNSIVVFVAAVSVGGLVGTLVDSLMGATVQTMYWCPKCKKETERVIHKCGTATSHKRGFKWFDNDVVNLFSSLAGGAVALGLFYLLSSVIK